MSVLVKNNQSTFDIATQVNGDVKSVVDFCIKNNLSFTQDLQPSTILEEPESDKVVPLIRDFFFNGNYTLATGEPQTLPDETGIGSMIIESDFDVTE